MLEHKLLISNKEFRMLNKAIIRHAAETALRESERQIKKKMALDNALNILDGLLIDGLQGRSAYERAENYLKQSGFWPI